MLLGYIPHNAGLKALKNALDKREILQRKLSEWPNFSLKSTSLNLMGQLRNKNPVQQ